MLVEGSPEWQRWIFIVASLLLLWEVWRGWRLGAVRGLLRLAALFCAWIGGSAAAGATGTFLAFFSKVPPLLAPAIAGLSVGLGIYLLISLAAGLLFKTTRDHAGIVRFGFGAVGALCGVLYGLLLLWAGISLIRGLGALGEMRMIGIRQDGAGAVSSPIPRFLVKLKASLELGATGKTLRHADPLPTAFYDNIVKLSMVAGDPSAMERFLGYPGTLKILSNPRVRALLEDPALLRATETRNFLPLLRNSNLLALAGDPALPGLIRSFDLTGALDYALVPQAPGPRGNPRPPASQRSPRGTSSATNSPVRVLTNP
jgi:hypothetical protein